MLTFGQTVYIMKLGKFGVISGIFPSDLLPIEVYLYEEEKFGYYLHQELGVCLM